MWTPPQANNHAGVKLPRQSCGSNLDLCFVLPVPLVPLTQSSGLCSSVLINPQVRAR
eukprot:CAMPEP_0202383978 /NCGR_PEP_ID=MMETSP1127-20130417/52419_1 /ASSEMBLY_ACC=CAM_ASM_000462 /TAXON_ID=3047 /ORGANISM="Dunaliella tertiolecta, Strain CCMP1320" /LENGTH=56 /DNA_ID=CAMNT_0048983623 /DNA_START=1 /DNA_END=168 /DNA_ORIENTATION=-